jgi:protein TonB
MTETPHVHSSSAVLAEYEKYDSSASQGSGLFRVVLLICLCCFGVIGFVFSTIKPVAESLTHAVTEIRTQFIMKEEKQKQKALKKPVDLTQKPILAQKEEDVKDKPPEAPVAPRRVFGLKKVYSQGLGAGGRLSDAVVGKLGNTLDKEVDTLTATKEDIKGVVVSVTTVTTAPRFLKKVKPEYTPEMIENKIEGVIKVKVLVDIDGKVKQAIVLDDLGYGSNKRALDACLQMLFEPAMRGDEPVAVWIIVPIRFVLLG